MPTDYFFAPKVIGPALLKALIYHVIGKELLVTKLDITNQQQSITKNTRLKKIQLLRICYLVHKSAYNKVTIDLWDAMRNEEAFATGLLSLDSRWITLKRSTYITGDFTKFLALNLDRTTSLKVK